MEIVPTNVLTNAGDKKVRYKMDCHILQSFIRDHIAFYNCYYLLSNSCYHYAKIIGQNILLY